MDHHPAECAVGVQQRLRAQPVEQRVAIGREQHALQVGIDLALVVLATLGDGQQREVVVAQHADGVGAQRMHQAQGFQRFAAAVDEVAAEPQLVARRVECDLLQQSLRRCVAALQVTDGPDAHASTGPAFSAACAASTA